jgi:8-oxo-dGTP pyrophosphatase MutT (NUDIX family)
MKDQNGDHPRGIRYQAAILREDHLLLLKVWDHAFSGRTFWVIPGGKKEDGESEMQCIQREAREETQLQVGVERLLLDEVDPSDSFYERSKTYLCRVIGGEAGPGVEPEVDRDGKQTIQAVRWFDLRKPDQWGEMVLRDEITAPLLRRIRAALGYDQ